MQAPSSNQTERERCLTCGESELCDFCKPTAPGDLSAADLAEIDAQFGLTLDGMRRAKLI